MDLSILQRLRAAGSAPSGMTQAERRAKTLNQEVGDLQDYDCPRCKNRGYIARVVSDDDIVLARCECMNIRESVRLMRQSGLMGVLERCTFDTFETPDPWQQQVKDAAVDYTRNGAGKWLLASGNVGSGKTHLCTAVSAEMMRAGKRVRYMLWREEAPKLKALVNEREEYDRLMQQLKEADVLYIDDFWKGTVSPADVNLSFELLNARYLRPDKMTLLSSELTIQKILEIDEAVGSRIYEKSRGYRLRFSGKNWRLRA